MRADLDGCMREQDGMLKFMADLSTRLHACEKELKRLKDIQALFDEKLERACLLRQAAPLERSSPEGIPDCLPIKGIREGLSAKGAKNG